jgi:type VI protein secretion system component VasF
MAPPQKKENKSENFGNFVTNQIDKLSDGTKKVIMFLLLLAILVVLYFIVQHFMQKKGGSLLAEMTDVSPMAPLTQTPQL